MGFLLILRGSVCGFPKYPGAVRRTRHERRKRELDFAKANLVAVNIYMFWTKASNGRTGKIKVACHALNVHEAPSLCTPNESKEHTSARIYRISHLTSNIA
jgi:hypothetical protein